MERAARDFSSDLSQLAAMREFVREVCQRAWGPGAGAEALDGLQLAVSEAAANAILHAYHGEGGRPIELAVEAHPDRASVCLYHEGESFDPASAPPPVFGQGRESGFGLYVIKQSVDEVRYLVDERGRPGICLVKNRG